MATTTFVDPQRSGGALYRFLRSIPTWVLWVLVGVWLTPTIGLLINSFRDSRGATRQRLVERRSATSAA